MSNGHGGQRAGAGRPAGRVSEVKVRLSQLAREHSDNRNNDENTPGGGQHRPENTGWEQEPKV